MNNDNVGAIYYDASIRTDDFIKGVNKIEKATSNLEKNVDQNTTKASGSFTKVGVVIGAVSGVVTSVFNKAINTISKSIGTAIKRVDTLNNSSRTFDNMGFKAADSAEAIAELNKSILGLPTSLDAGVRGMTALAATYGDVKKGQKVFSALNNAILGFGGTADMVDNAILQLSQIPMDGPLDAQTWRSLRNSGLTPVLVAMAKDMGVSVDVLKTKLGEGDLTVKDFTDRLIKLNKDGGGGMKSLEKIARDSTRGIGTGFANAKTAVARGIAKILESIGSSKISETITAFGAGFEKTLGFVSSLVGALKSFGKQIVDYVGPKVQSLVKSIGENLMPLLKDLWHNVLEPLIPVIGTTLVAAFGAVIDIAKVVVDGIGFIYEKFKEGNPIVLGLAGVFGTLAAAMAFNAIFNALSVGFATLTLITIPSAVASMTALKALIMLPIVMPAIAVGAALAAIGLVLDAAKRMQDAVQGAQNAQKNAFDNDMQSINAAKAKYASGEISKETYQKIIRIATRAGGGPVSANTPYLVGENKDGSMNRTSELFVPSSSGSIINSGDLQDMLKGGSSGNVTVNLSLSGVMTSSKADERALANRIGKLLNETLSAKGAPMIEGI